MAYFASRRNAALGAESRFPRCGGMFEVCDSICSSPKVPATRIPRLRLRRVCTIRSALDPVPRMTAGTPHQLVRHSKRLATYRDNKTRGGHAAHILMNTNLEYIV